MHLKVMSCSVNYYYLNLNYVGYMTFFATLCVKGTAAFVMQ